MKSGDNFKLLYDLADKVHAAGKAASPQLVSHFHLGALG